MRELGAATTTVDAKPVNEIFAQSEDYVAEEEALFAVDDALAAALQFLDLWEMPLDPGTLRPHEGYSSRTDYYPTQIGLVNDDYTIIVAGPEPRVVSFSNRKRNENRFKNRERTGQLRFANEEEMRDYIGSRVQQLTASWEFPAVLTKLDWYGDSTPGKGDSNRGGMISANYEVRPYGRRGGLAWLQVVLDPQDGTILNYSYSDRMQIESNELLIVEAVARVSAQALAAAHRPGAGAVVSAELMYLCPNGRFGSSRTYMEDKVPLVRLAWSVDFEDGTRIAIDAGTGESLGGASPMTRRP